jgi:endonuclease YncB( thermonuclease family)
MAGFAEPALPPRCISLIANDGVTLMISRLSRNDRVYFWSAVGAAALLAALGLGLSVLDHAPQPAPRAALPAQPAVAASAPTDKVQERAGPAVPQFTPQQTVELEPPYTILDGLTLASGPVVLRLSGLEGPAAKAACRDENGHAWACGLQARAALNNKTRKQKLICTVADEAADGIPEAACAVEGEDLGLHLVAEGWARPLKGAPESHLTGVQEARAAKRGLWNGDWAIVESGVAQDASTDLRRAVSSP